MIIKICRLFFYKVVQRGIEGRTRAVLSGDLDHLLPVQTTGDEGEKLTRGLLCLASALLWLLLSDAEQTAELENIDGQRNVPAKPSRQPPARAGQLAVAGDLVRTGQTWDQSCWHTASHFWQPLTVLRLWKGSSIWEQIWPKVFPFNSSACGFWWIKKNHTEQNYCLSSQGLSSVLSHFYKIKR